MLRLEIGVSTYYVAGGKHLRRLWRRAVKHGFKGVKGHIVEPKYHPRGTYYMEFYPESKVMVWGNFAQLTADS